MVRNPSKQPNRGRHVMKKLNIDPTHSNKPSAIEYRLKRAHSAASVVQQFLGGVDADLFGDRLLEARRLAAELETMVSDIRSAAPQKRIHGKKAREAAGIVDAPPAPKRPRGRPKKVVAQPTVDAVLSEVEALVADVPAAEPAAELQNAAE